MDQTSIFAQRIYPGRRTDAPPSALMGVSTIITYNAEVIALRRSGDDSRVLWRDRASGAEQPTEAPFALCTIPVPGAEPSRHRFQAGGQEIGDRGQSESSAFPTR